MITEKWHRHFGVYGICTIEDKLLVVHKTSGPYRNRYDLPGGSMEPDETIEQTLTREFIEETGYELLTVKHLGFSEFIVKYDLRDNTHIQHIPLFFRVQCGQQSRNIPNNSDDTSGCEWISIHELNTDNSSPLVSKAKDMLLRVEFVYESKKFEDWTIKE